MKKIFREMQENILPELFEMKNEIFFSDLMLNREDSHQEYELQSTEERIGDYRKRIEMVINPSIDKKKNFIRNMFDLDKVLNKIYPNEDIEFLLSHFYPALVGVYHSIILNKKTVGINNKTIIIEKDDIRKSFNEFKYYDAILYKYICLLSFVDKPLKNENHELKDKLIRNLFRLDLGNDNDLNETSRIFIESFMYSGGNKKQTLDYFKNNIIDLCMSGTVSDAKKIYKCLDFSDLNVDLKMHNSYSDMFQAIGSDNDNEDDSNFLKTFRLKKLPSLIEDTVINLFKENDLISSLDEKHRFSIANAVMDKAISGGYIDSFQELLKLRKFLGLKEEISSNSFTKIINSSMFTDSVDNIKIFKNYAARLNEKDLFKSLTGMIMNPDKNSFFIESLDLFKDKANSSNLMKRGLDGLFNSNLIDKGSLTKVENILMRIMEDREEYLTPNDKLNIFIFSLSKNKSTISPIVKYLILQDDYYMNILNTYVEQYISWRTEKKENNNLIIRHGRHGNKNVTISNVFTHSSTEVDILKNYILSININKAISEVVQVSDFESLKVERFKI